MTARRSRSVLATAAYGTFLVLVAYTVPMTTLTPTAVGLHAGPTAQTWVLTGTLVGLSALLLAAGSLADDRGRKRVFTAGAVLLVLSSAVAAAAPTVAVFLAARVVQGAASAALLAPSLGLIGEAYPGGPARVRALGVWGAAVGLGIAVGPVYAALAEQWLGWRAVYWGLAALAALLVVVAVAGLDESRAATPRRIDLPGVLTLGNGTAALIAGLAEGRYGWGRPIVLVLLAVGILLLVAFAFVEAHTAEPILDLRLFRDPGFVAATGGALFTGLAIVGLMSCLPSALQRALGLSSLAASGVLAIWSGLSVAAALQARRLADRIGGIAQLAIGLLICGVGEVALLGLRPDDSWLRLVPGLAVAGVGSGILNAALGRLAVTSVPAHRAAMGSGANNTARYLGSSLGVAVTVTLMGLGGPATARAAADGTNHAVLAATALCALGAAGALVARAAQRRGRARAAAEAEPQPAVELLR
ncbi:MFS transporter [Kitasatospora cathayae]|uniref:MFS transporter n=1 Tax=Kitasatospora cathayae TaxID=3004092 RepID=A0ABY7PXJ1_9ACTN|nr:MFS transporter [Kitasatospora sp. HUAS 3-15]WBP85070.1 MFS transporter [Kitasatospora sp. HUAS 3-15]